MGTGVTSDGTIEQRGDTPVPAANTPPTDPLNTTSSSGLPKYNDPSLLESSAANVFKAKLISSTNSGRVVIFDVTPEINETRQALYDPLTPLHMPGNIMVYKGSASRQYTISARFVSRTSKEARRNLTMVNLLRGWLMPYFGKGTAESEHNSAAERAKQELKSNLGAPPEVLLFSAYSNGRGGNVNRVPVVITNLSIPYTSEVDYIPTANTGVDDDKLGNIPFPTILSIELTLTETHSPEEYSNFDLIKYRAGILPNY